MKQFDRFEKKLKEIFGNSYIDNFGIFLLISGCHNISLLGTFLGVSVWLYYLYVFLLTAYHANYVQVDNELFIEAIHSAVTVFITLVYFLAYRMMAGRITELARYLDNEPFTYGDTLDLDSQKEISDIYDSTKKRKRGALYLTLFNAFYTFVMFILAPILYGSLWLDDDDNYITRASFMTKYSMFDARTGVGRYVDLIMDTTMCICYFIMLTVMDAPFICYAEDSCQQLDILNVTLKNVYRRARYVFEVKYGRETDSYDSSEFGECLTLCMKDTVKHHVMAITCCKKMSDAFTVPVFVVFSTGSVLLCHEVMQLSTLPEDKGELIDPAINLLFDTAQGLLFAYYGERFLQANLDVHKEVYALGWENSLPALKSYLHIMQSYSITVTVRLTALGFFDYNFIGFKNVISTAYSYYNFLTATDT